MEARIALLRLITLFLSLFLNCETVLGLIMNSSTELIIGCSGMEREALFKFKEGLKDPSGRLSSWVGQDCCAWKGVRCNKQTGTVVNLDLSNKGYLGGTLNPSLLQLKQLRFLNLSNNGFDSTIPIFLGSLEKLVYLDLSYASFFGMVPPHLGNLSNLRYLNLGRLPACNVSDLNWISRLSSLEYLNLDGMDISLATTHWLQALNMLPFLSELHLSFSGLESFPHSLPYLNFTFLSVLDLSYNYFNSLVPPYLLNMSSSLEELNLRSCQLKGLFAQLVRGTSCNIRRLDLGENDINGEAGVLLTGLSRCNNNMLEELDLSTTQLFGQLPATSLEHLSFKLRVLRLENNTISGPLPASISRLSNLEELNLGFNNMNVTIPESGFQNLTKLRSLNIWSNIWEGVSLSENHFVGLKSLKEFYISSSSPSGSHACQFNLSNNWNPPFSLEALFIDDCLLGPTFPAWLESQTQLLKLTLSHAGIESTIPSWFWKSSRLMSVIDFSSNQIRGTIPDNIGHTMFSTEILDLSGNLITGSIPISMSKMKHLENLNLSNNSLHGQLPDVWTSMRDLNVLDLSDNKFSGNIPTSLCTSISDLQWLKLSRNNFSGELPSSLRHCTYLASLDLGDNNFYGHIPQWLDESLFKLSLLRIRGNAFTGKIPQNLCRLPELHLLDLSLNNLSGSIPQCLGNLSALISFSMHEDDWGTMDSIVKGASYEFYSTLHFLNLIDLSNNELSGEIPEEITKLVLLGTLNLSRNQLTGRIPEKIGDLKLVESLDLSWNHLSGAIPPGMISMTLLSRLNLSFNNLSGTIPSDNQFLTFDDLTFSGNPGLRRLLPLTNGNVPVCRGDQDNKCRGPEYRGKLQSGHRSGIKNENNLGVYISSISGFFVGFWAVCGSLAIKESWRIAFFGYVGKVSEWVLVFVSVNVNRMRGRE